MKKVIINTCYGGFSLSDTAKSMYATLTGADRNELFEFDLQRDDPTLVMIVEELGDKANGMYAELKIVEIPDDVEWHIQDYDGVEWVAENHRTWG